MTTANNSRLIRAVLLAVVLVAAAAAATDRTAGEQAAARVAALQAEIARHDDLYFRRAAPEITDAEYDAMKRELAELREAHPELFAAEAETPGDDRTGRFPTRAHRAPMLGLDKSHTEAELRRFLDRVARAAAGAATTCVIEPKYDGLAVSLVYADGRLLAAVTRGDGGAGDDITANLLAGAAVPLRLEGGEVPRYVEIRGEACLPHAEFARLNAERAAAGLTPFAHPRNVAVGILKSLPGLEAAPAKLEVVAYGLGGWEPAAGRPRSQQETLARLQAWGWRVPPAVVATDAGQVWRAVSAIAEQRKDEPLPIDGAVVKVDDFALRDRLGDARHAPRWAIAHKFAPERVPTRLLAITLQVGRTGQITPVAELAPVRLGGATVTRASLHHRREVERRDYRVGDWVWVERAGEVIPQLAGVDHARRPPEAVPFSFPAECPGCATALVSWPEGSGERCPNRRCLPQVKRRIEHFASAAAVNIRGLGPALAGTLVDRGLLADVDGLYTLREEDLPAAEGGVGGRARNLRAEIERSRRAELWRFIHGLGLAEVGAVNARKLARHFGGLAALRDARPEDLQAAGLGPAAAAALGADLARPEVGELITRLLAAGVMPDATPRQ